MRRWRGLTGAAVIAFGGMIGAWPASGSTAAAQEKPPVAPPASPPQAPPAKSKVETDVAAAQRMMTEGRWKDAVAALTKLLSENEGSSEVLSRLAVIEDLLKRATFKAGWKSPQGSDLLGPSCVKLVGNVAEFHTTPGRTGWTQSGGVAVFEPQFDGEVTVAFNWAWIRGNFVVPPPSVLLAYDAEKNGGYLAALQVATSAYSESITVTGLVIRLDDGAQKEVGRDAGQSYTADELTGAVTYQRTTSLVSVKVGKREIARANESKYRGGSVAFIAGDGGLPAVVLVKGKLSDTYLRRLRAEAENNAFREWEASEWVRVKALPGWVLEAEKGSVTATSILPRDAESADVDALRARLRRHYDGDRRAFKGCEAELNDAPKSVARYIRGLIALDDGRLDRADECFRIVIAADPTFGPAHLGIAQVHRARGEADDAKSRLAEARRLAPKFAPVYVFAAQVSLDDEDVAGARKALDDATSQGAMSVMVSTLRGVLHRMENGPPWTKRFTVQTAHFDVFSDHSQGICGEVGKQLEDAFAAYQAKFRPTTAKRRAKVYVFSGEQSYLDYAADMGSDLRNTLGVYMPTLRQLAVFLHEDRVELWNTVRHEGFHQYLHQLADDVPLWFNEGYAEFFGFSRRKLGKTVTGQADGFQREAMRLFAPSFTPVEELLQMDRQTFMDKAAVHYVQSWSIIHFLRETKHPELKGLLDRYLDALIAGKGREGAYTEVLEPVITTLNREWRIHIAALGR